MNIKFKLRSINLPTESRLTLTVTCWTWKPKQNIRQFRQSLGWDFYTRTATTKNQQQKSLAWEWQLPQWFYINCYYLHLDGNDDDDSCATGSFCNIGHQQVIFRALMANNYSPTPRQVPGFLVSTQFKNQSQAMGNLFLFGVNWRNWREEISFIVKKLPSCQVTRGQKYK